MRIFGVELKNPFSVVAPSSSQKKETIPTLTPFIATIESITLGERNGQRQYEMTLAADGVNHLIPAYLPLFLQPYSDTPFEELKKDDVIKTGVFRALIEPYGVPVSVLGTVEKLPPDSDIKNKLPVELGYQTSTARPTAEHF